MKVKDCWDMRVSSGGKRRGISLPVLTADQILDGRIAFGAPEAALHRNADRDAEEKQADRDGKRCAALRLVAVIVHPSE